jgi:hypothetical protein
MDSQVLQTLDISSTTDIEIYCDPSIKEGGGIIWDAAHALTRFISKPLNGFSAYFKLNLETSRLSVLELGAGTGFVGLAFAKIFPESSVILTEMSDGCLQLMKKSVS